MAVLMQCTPMFMRAAHATTGGDDGFSVMGMIKMKTKYFLPLAMVMAADMWTVFITST